MAQARSARAINRGGKNSVRNLRYGPRTRLVRGMFERMNAWRCKISFLCINTLWVGENSKIERARLQLCATIPATSCECERSASSLRRLHTHNWACTGQERLSSLALMHIHYQVKIDLDEVVNLFATKHPRRLELGTILKD